MSAPPLGSISLTFMLDHSISLSLLLALYLLFCPSLLVLCLPPLFAHYPVSFPFALHESHTSTFAASAVVAV